MSRVDFGSRTAVLRRGPFSIRFRMRTALIGAALALATVVVAILALCLGDLPLSPVDVVSALLGSQEGLAHLVVFEWRLPRVLSAMVFGAALGVSGAIFQSLTRNPLASPDVIGLSAGSYAGGLIMIIVFGVGAGSVPVAGGAIIGGLLAAAAVYVLAYRNGMHGFRLIVVGIGVSAMLEALGVYLILRAKLEVAMVASVWALGSLNPVGWAQLVPAVVVVAVVFVALGTLVGPMRQLELGDDAARSLGSRVEPARLWLVVCAVALSAVVTGAAGPIAFISLAAPQIAKRITRTAGIALVPSALVGALVLTASDIVAQFALPDNLPVGLVTVVGGGGYLVWLLIHEVRRRR
ncbi:iron chelate uptake ABC transporter family permease subunit [Agreia sp. VKM Ac-1783]|uniref:FecCD family ABC transporter permease n=1 Tax=Agreia sp. VKM Ac-1783 TaxID=1938889 RepID=UPI000A2AE232|nr:iron chelate uptake ABC transporter family permease subunit [Agreia sp. VKM Ac-1783]SMQ75385.1 iron complex transport system permease protein [Agreia sp. VKM Ac-1783]